MNTSISLSQFNPTIVIENFPSRTELFYIINDYLSTNKLTKEFETYNQHNSLKLTFQSQQIAYDLLSHLKQLSLNNDLYSRLKCYMLIEANSKNNKSSSNHRNMQRSYDLSHERSKTMGNNESVLTSASSSIANVKKLHAINHKNKRNHKHQRNNTINNIQIRDESESYIHKHFSDIRSKAGIMSTASPYLTVEEKIKLSDKKCREKNISPEDFKRFIGKATINKMPIVKNYVTVTPSESPLTILFRKNDNKKWICNKKFWI